MSEKFPRNRHLAPNAIGTILVHGLVNAKDGSDVVIEAAFVSDLPPVATLHHTCEPWLLPDGIPPFVDVGLPHPLDLHLDITVGPKHDRGRYGSVYLASASRLYDPFSPSGSLEPPVAPVLPELVIKIAAFEHQSSIAREAAMYNELLKIQGVSIPRCYGWFEADLVDGYTVRDMKEGYPEHKGGVSENDDIVDSPTRKLSFLLLECVGEGLTMRVDYRKNKGLWQVFHDLSHMGVEHHDIRYANILCAPPAPPGFNGKKCPFHRKVHNFRVIDFDRSVKSDYNLVGHESVTYCSMAGVLEGIAGGYRVEPWAT